MRANFVSLLIPILAIVSVAAAVQDDATTRPAPGTLARSTLLQQSDRAIKKGVEYLLARQNPDGSFNGPGESDTHGGRTALVTLALLHADVSRQHPQIVKAIDFLKKRNPTRVYDLSLRAAVYAMLPESQRKNELRRDVDTLRKAVIAQGDDRGMYGYYTTGRTTRGDYSNSQYGVLGVWYAAMAGVEVPNAYWSTIEQGWRSGQNPDGGWGYLKGYGSSYGSMTAAGLATILITNDYLHFQLERDLTVPRINRSIQAAHEWLAANFAVEHNPGLDTPAAALNGGSPMRDRMRRDFQRDALTGTYIFYMLFGYERVGEASGLTRFGPHKWFDVGAEFLIRVQNYDGSWEGNLGPMVDTSYALLFLTRGRAPVIAQKLRYDGRWNNRSRDLSSFVKFYRRASERHVNWQIVEVDAPLIEYLESPILYISGDRRIELTGAQKQKLRDYVHRGGLIVAVNEGTRDDFANSITELLKELFPFCTLKPLTASHPLYTANFPVGDIRNWKALSISNGLRDLAILLPTGDFSWELHASGGAYVRGAQSPSALLANLLLHVTDRQNPRYKGESFWIDRDESARAPDRVIRVAQLTVGSTDIPEPAAYQRLANILHNAQDATLQATTIDLAKSAIDPGTHLAHLLAIDPPVFDDAARKALVDYIQAGGLILFESATAEAGASIRALLAELFPAGKLQSLSIDHPIFRGEFPRGIAIEFVGYRRMTVSDGSPRTPRVEGLTIDGKLVAIYSREDLTGAMVGYPNSTLVGYTPESAVAIMRNLLLWRSR